MSAPAPETDVFRSPSALLHQSPFTPSCNFTSHRSPVLCRNGAVCCSQPLAASAGVRALQDGCNAAEAAIVVTSCLTVLEPCSTGIGGDCFALMYESVNGKVRGLNGSGRSPMALDESKLTASDRNPKGDALNRLSVHCVTVPGAVAGWFDTLEKWGSGKFTMAQLLQPAIQMARDGVPIAPMTAESWARYAPLLRKQNGLDKPCVLLPNGNPPAAGDIYCNEDLALTLELIAKEGKKGFYTGEVAQSIVDCTRARGGLLSMEDFAAHQSTFPEPICVEYKGVNIWEIPPNGQGITALLAMNILQEMEKEAARQKQTTTKSDTGDSTSSSSVAATPSNFAHPLLPLKELGHNSPEYLHRVIEVMRLAFADTRYFVCDSEHSDAQGKDQGVSHRKTIKGLLAPSYARERAQLFDPSRSQLNYPHGSPVNSSSTVSFCVVDSQGNAMSFINSNYQGFGTGIVVPGRGFSLQNRGANFTLDPLLEIQHSTAASASSSASSSAVPRSSSFIPHPNRLAGGKRPYHTIIPGLLTVASTGALYGPFSVMGGYNQPQGHVQLLLNHLEFGMEPQQAIDQPRFCIESGTTGGEVKIEEGIEEATIEKLRSK